MRQTTSAALYCVPLEARVSIHSMRAWQRHPTRSQMTMLLLVIGLAGCRGPVDRHERAPLVGNFSGTTLRVPADHVWIWERDRDATKRAHSCGSALRSALIQLRWPEMKPRNSETAADFKKYHSGATGDSQWIEIGMTQATPRARLSLESQRDWAMFRSRPNELPTGVEFEYRRDTVTGLNIAYPRMQVKEGHAWNRRFYSDSFDQHHRPAVFISCMTGPQYRPPSWTPLCEQPLDEPGFEQVHLSIVYRQNLLPHWREINRDVRSYLRDIQSSCPTTRNVKEI